MDYKEEQSSELEAIEAIYPNEFTLLSEDPIELLISVKSESFDEESGEGLCSTLRFKFVPKYPEEPPEVEVMVEDDEEPDDNVITNLDPEDVTTLQELLVQQATENVGMAMVFTLVSGAIEWMNNRWDGIIKEREEEAERKRIAEEEAEHQRFEGTRVTVATFIAWKTAFDEELAAKKKLQQQNFIKEKDPESKKLTGKELFLRDKTLAESDLQFTEDGDDAAPIDESLFEDLDDLDIGNSDGDEDDDE